MVIAVTTAAVLATVRSVRGLRVKEHRTRLPIVSAMKPLSPPK
jgi:hypothetical protein